VAVAGIAQPDRFLHSLESSGWPVARALTFRDHHLFTSSDVAAMARAVDETGAVGIVTTEKDAVRLLPWRPLPAPVAALPLQVVLDPPGAFDAWLLDHLRRVRA
jgi:tetraacyldisaccharide 4'-kinase